MNVGEKVQPEALVLEHKLASGGMAEVWSARCHGLSGFSKRFAVKMILPHLMKHEDFTKMFLDEARLAGHLEHPNICQVFWVGEVSDTYHMVMEYIPGETLNKLMDKAQRRGLMLPLSVCCQIVMEVATGLSYAHAVCDQQGRPLHIIHRDISPPNVMVSRDGGVKVIDFGVAKASTQVHQTRTGTIKGKYAYMAPEQVENLSLDRRTDIFALGVVMWELLTGRGLFHADTDAGMMKKVLSAEYPPPTLYRPNCPLELEELVMRALAASPKERFQTCGELLAALEQLCLQQRWPMGRWRLGQYVRWLLGEEGAEIPEGFQASWVERGTGPARPAGVTGGDTLGAIRRGSTRGLLQQAQAPTRGAALRQEQRDTQDELVQSLQLLRSRAADEAFASRQQVGEASRILLVDDQPEILDTVRMVLEAAGYEVTLANDGVEAVERVQESHFDLCLLDLDMPRLDGKGALMKIHHLYPTLPCVIHTANKSFQKAAELGRLGAVTYIPKPSKRRQLLDTIREVLATRPADEELERMIRTSYPTPLADVRYRFWKASKRTATAKLRHGLLASQFELLASWCGTIMLATYVQDRSFHAQLNQTIRSWARRVNPNAWWDLFVALVDAYDATKTPFWSRELRDLFRPSAWDDEASQTLLHKIHQELSPLLGEPADPEATTQNPHEVLQLVCRYYEDLWRDVSLLDDREVEVAIEVLEPFLLALYQRLVRLSDFDLVRVDAAELTREGVHHELTILRGLNPERSQHVARTQLEAHALYLFDRCGRVAFPLSPFALAKHDPSDKDEEFDVAFVVRMEPEGRLTYRSATTGRLVRPDAIVQQQVRNLFEHLLSPEERTQRFQQNITILFTDLEGSTAFYEKHGDVAGRLLIHSHDNLLFPVVDRHHGRVVKTIGDSIMAAFPEPHDAIHAALEMQQLLHEYNQKPQTEHPIHIRIGLHTGPGIVEPDDVYGDVVNTAARVEQTANADEILLSEPLRQTIEEDEGFAQLCLEPIQEVKLKGKDEPITLYRLSKAT